MNTTTSLVHETLERLIISEPPDLLHHSRTVARLSANMAQAAGCSFEECSQIRTGSLLHDIGKQFIPEVILSKQGRLSPKEYNRIQEHPWIGYSYLTQFTTEPDLLHTVLYHHERWNGTGYPNRLAGDMIPLGARICALADVWDALVSDRCYRSAWSMNQAMDLIWAGAGSLFDPHLAFQFLTMVEAQYSVGNETAEQRAPARPIAGCMPQDLLSVPPAPVSNG